MNMNTKESNISKKKKLDALISTGNIEIILNDHFNSNVALPLEDSVHNILRKNIKAYMIDSLSAKHKIDQHDEVLSNWISDLEDFLYTKLFIFNRLKYSYYCRLFLNILKIDIHWIYKSPTHLFNNYHKYTQPDLMSQVVEPAAQSDDELVSDHKCFKCNGSKVVYSQVAARSGDEGYVIFFSCLGCGNRWKN